MKLLVGLFVSLAICSTFALPAGSPADDVEYVPTNRRTNYFGRSEEEEPDFKDFRGVISSGPEQGYGRYPFFSSLPSSFNLNYGFFNAFEDIFRRLRTQLLAAEDSEEPSSESSESGTFPFALNSKNGNTTSVVKIVNGHKVEINDTVYGGDNGRSVFKVRLINIRPIEDKDETDDVGAATEIAETKTITEDKGSPEVMEKSNNNEIDGDIDELESTSTTEMHDTPTERITENFSTNAVFDFNSDVASQSADPIDLPESIESTKELSTEGIENIVNHKTQSNMLKNEEQQLSIDFGSSSQAHSEERTDETMADIENVTEKSITMEKDSDEIFFLANHNEDAPSLLSFSLPLLDIDNDATETKMTNTPITEMTTVASSLTDYIKADHEKNEKILQTQPPSTSSKPLKEELLFSEEDEDNEDDKNNNYEKFESNERMESMEGVVDNDNNLDNDIDAYEGISVDLSNDIAINDILADQGAPFEPEAELFSIDEFNSPKSARIDFHGLSSNGGSNIGRIGGKYQTSVNTQLSYNQPIKK